MDIVLPDFISLYFAEQILQPLLIVSLVMLFSAGLVPALLGLIFESF